MKRESSSEENEINKKLKEIVIARINARMSPNLKLSMGASGSLDKGEMIEHVLKGDELGNQIIKVHLNFMKAQSTGELTKALNTLA